VLCAWLARKPARSVPIKINKGTIATADAVAASAGAGQVNAQARSEAVGYDPRRCDLYESQPRSSDPNAGGRAPPLRVGAPLLASYG